jgi:hypothetical protein
MRYIEDLVEQFVLGKIRVSNFDEKISHSLGLQCLEGKAFTQKQSEIALRLVRKYRAQFKNLGVDVDTLLENSIFKFPIRIIDQTKIVQLDDKNKKIVIKFPYNQNVVTLLRSINQKDKMSKAEWDPDKKYWTLDLNETSLAFINTNLIDEFELDEDIKSYIEQYNSIRENFEDYVPTLLKFDNTYFFKNIKSDFTSVELMPALVESAKLGVSVYDETVGQELTELVNITPLAKIYESNHNQKFSVNSSKYAKRDILRLIMDMNVNTAIFVDENTTAETLTVWFNELLEIGVDVKDIGVFFRRKNDEDGIRFNKIVKDLSLNKEANHASKWVFLSNKYPKSLLKNNHNIDVCLFVNKYITSHYSVTNISKNSIFSLYYNEHTTAEADIVNL